jgi:hypothetical protein
MDACLKQPLLQTLGYNRLRSHQEVGGTTYTVTTPKNIRKTLNIREESSTNP